MKIKVTQEGRKDIWIPDKTTLKIYILEKELDVIHNFTPMGNMICGADHEVYSVFEDIDRADRLVIFTNEELNYGHSLALIFKNELQIYDIGRIREKDLEIVKKEVKINVN